MARHACREGLSLEVISYFRGCARGHNRQFHVKGGYRHENDPMLTSGGVGNYSLNWISNVWYPLRPHYETTANLSSDYSDIQT